MFAGKTNRKAVFSRTKAFTGFCALIIALGWIVESYAQSTANLPGTPIRQLSRIPFGWANRTGFLSLPDTTTYQSVAIQQFNFLTPENDMKFDTVEPQQNSFNFVPGDQHVAFAQANGMAVKGHNLVWHQQVPSWLTNLPNTAAARGAAMDNHIAMTVGHWKGKIALWDVVNEPFNGDGTLNTSSPWAAVGAQCTTAGGTCYIARALQDAKAADPNVLVGINDFGIEGVNSKSTALLNMVTLFKQQGIPIDYVGFETHLVSSGISPQD